MADIWQIYLIIKTNKCTQIN